MKQFVAKIILLKRILNNFTFYHDMNLNKRKPGMRYSVSTSLKGKKQVVTILTVLGFTRLTWLSKFSSCLARHYGYHFCVSE